MAVGNPTPGGVYAQIRNEAPSFWAEFGADGSVIGALEEVATPTRECFASAARADATGSRTPFARGLVGWLGYEAGAWFETMPPRPPTPLPPAWWGRVKRWARFDAQDRLVAHSPGLANGSFVEPALPRPTGRLAHLPEPAEFLGGVRTIQQHLRAGDVYQVNLARRLVVARAGDPLHAWLRLRASNRARRGLLLETRHGSVVSNSPELFLRQRHRSVLTVPIKGTAPLSNPRADLLQSAKERAELTMIVDLVRADLGRVSTAGTVRAETRRVGRVGHLWHAMQRVRAQLAPGRDTVDLLAATFPAGSVTGAPKVAAMQLINHLEPGPRGVYCGAAGWIGPGGCELNVAIRTIEFAGGEASVQVGAGIVLGSDPARELAETEFKAARMLQALLA